MDLTKNANLQPFNTFHISAKAAYLGRFRTVEELRGGLSDPAVKDLPLLVLGGGSNVLLTRDWPGLVLLNEVSGMDVLAEDADQITVRAGAGEVWHRFVMHCIGQGWGGLENLSLIPGKVGAAPMQNIGAYGVEIKDVFDHLEALRIEDGEVVRFSGEDCRFGYRDSYFKQEGKGRYIILNVVFKLSKRPVVNVRYGSIQYELDKRGVVSPTIRDVSDAVIAIRRSKLPDPLEIGSAGSFFKNPVLSAAAAEAVLAQHPEVVHYPIGGSHVKFAAGWLIEHAGWKGYREGDHGIYKDQALVLVNYGGSEGSAIHDLSTRVQKSVKERFGVELEPEVNIL